KSMTRKPFSASAVAAAIPATPPPMMATLLGNWVIGELGNWVIGPLAALHFERPVDSRETAAEPSLGHDAHFARRREAGALMEYVVTARFYLLQQAAIDSVHDAERGPSVCREHWNQRDSLLVELSGSGALEPHKRL